MKRKIEAVYIKEKVILRCIEKAPKGGGLDPSKESLAGGH